jgi:hypothetical protein
MSRTFFVFPIAIALGLTLGLSGLLDTASESNRVLPVLAQGGCTHLANWTCTGPPDGNKTSAMTVTYVDNSSGSSVIPNGATDWDITAHWYPVGPGSNCTDLQVATCTVAWNGSTWSLSNVNLTNDIVAISLCSTNMCGGASLAVGYTLIVSINDPNAGGNNLDNIDYVTTAVPNGTECGASSTTPLSQTNAGNQYISTGNTNICPFTCSVSGSSMTVLYN